MWNALRSSLRYKSLYLQNCDRQTFSLVARSFGWQHNFLGESIFLLAENFRQVDWRNYLQTVIRRLESERERLAKEILLLSNEPLTKIPVKLIISFLRSKGDGHNLTAAWRGLFSVPFADFIACPSATDDIWKHLKIIVAFDLLNWNHSPVKN